MKVYMALAPPWAQILPQPPPAAKYIPADVDRNDTQHALEVCGCCGGTENKNASKSPAWMGRAGEHERRNTMVTMTRDGQIIQRDELSQEQKEQAWALVFRSFLMAHPEVLEMGGQDAAGASTSPA